MWANEERKIPEIEHLHWKFPLRSPCPRKALDRFWIIWIFNFHSAKRCESLRKGKYFRIERLHWRFPLRSPCLRKTRYRFRILWIFDFHSAEICESMKKGKYFRVERLHLRFPLRCPCLHKTLYRFRILWIFDIHNAGKIMWANEESKIPERECLHSWPSLSFRHPCLYLCLFCGSFFFCLSLFL